jgi:hypothetical protein
MSNSESQQKKLQDVKSQNLSIPPPSRAMMMAKGPVESAEQAKTKFMQIGFTADSVPEFLDWSGKISPIMNQGSCGDCWAVSTTSVLADRTIIQLGASRDLMLQPIVTAQCVPNANEPYGCNGGHVWDAGKYFEKVGIPVVKNNCLDYINYCGSGKGNCTLPDCSTINQQCKDNTIYKAQPQTTRNLSVRNKDGTINIPQTINNMKLALLNGPISACFFTAHDFCASWYGYNWEDTGGVYINGKYEDILNNLAKTYKKVSTTIGADGNTVQDVRYPYQDYIDNHMQGGQKWGDIEGALQGQKSGHAVCIVGWGHKQITGLGDVPYWIVRNSWGTEWGNNGFCLFAMNDGSTDMNVELHLDIPYVAGPDGTKVPGVDPDQDNSNLFGGGLCFEPYGSSIDREPSQNVVKPDKSGKSIAILTSKTTQQQQQQTTHKRNVIIIIIVVICVIIFCVLLYFVLKNSVSFRRIKK